ncbi:MAG: YfhO family protein [Eubacterium ventriosum]
MWLDCMWLLPFIVLGLEKLVNEKKCKMYCISLALAIFSNYYIGLMICIFSIIYFVYLFCIVEFDETVEKTKARLLIFKRLCNLLNTWRCSCEHALSYQSIFHC